jgi:plasmid stability protein
VSKVSDIRGFIVVMSDVLIRDIPDDVLAGLDARAAELGLSRVEYIRRRLAQDARTMRVRVTTDDLRRLGQVAAGLADEELMREAWGR